MHPPFVPFPPYTSLPLSLPPSSPREELKHEAISSVLEEALTSSFLLYPCMGRIVYFEHKLRNTHNHPLSVTIAWKDPDLRYGLPCCTV